MSNSREEGDFRQEKEEAEELRTVQYYIDHPEQVTAAYTMATPKFLNNFYEHFPKPTSYSPGYYRYFAMHTDGMRRTFRQLLMRMNGYQQEYLQRYSEVRLDQTGAEFYETIDRIVYEIAPDYNNLYCDAVKKITIYNESRTLPIALTEIYVQVYKRMRALGYTHAELTG